jgi:hypothetical protein
MRQNLSLRTGLLAFVACSLLFIVGCRKLSGTYEAANTGVSINFKSADKADVSMTGMPGTGGTGPKETSYHVDGNKVTISAPDGSKQDLVLTINDDGSLSEPNTGFKFTKK